MGGGVENGDYCSTVNLIYLCFKLCLMIAQYRTSVIVTMGHFSGIDNFGNLFSIWRNIRNKSEIFGKFNTIYFLLKQQLTDLIIVEIGNLIGK